MSDGIDNAVKAAAAERARRVKFRVAGDVVARATKDLPGVERGALRWLHEHMRTLDLDIGEAADMVASNSKELTAVLQGDSPAPPELVSRIMACRAEPEAERTASPDGRPISLVRTSLTTDLWTACDKAREWQKIVYVIGPTQAGKTTALEAYGGERCSTQLPHGTAIFTRVPTGGSLPHYLDELAHVLQVPATVKQCHLRRRIMECFDRSMLLIVDEAHQCVMGRDRGNGVRTLEFVRELSDRCQCGMVVSATNVLKEKMDEAGPVAQVLKQSRERQLYTYQVAAPSEDDLNLFSAAYGLKPPVGEMLQLQTETVAQKALGFWLTLLRMAASVAHSQGRPVTWAGVKRADLGLKTLARQKAAKPAAKPAGKEGAK